MRERPGAIQNLLKSESGYRPVTCWRCSSAALRRRIARKHRALMHRIYHLSAQAASDCRARTLRWKHRLGCSGPMRPRGGLQITCRVRPHSVTTAKRGPKKSKPGDYCVAAIVARRRLSAAGVLCALYANTLEGMLPRNGG